MLTQILGIMIPIIGILAVAAIFSLRLCLNYRARKEMLSMYHQERMIAIDKGIDLPPLPAVFPGERAAFQLRPKNHLLKGLMGVLVGVALIVALNSLTYRSEHNWALIGLIPLAMGLAHLIYYFVAGRKEVEAPNTPVPPIPQRQQPK